jgi:diguanylate cyclase (GGDEF)-like protein
MVNTGPSPLAEGVAAPEPFAPARDGSKRVFDQQRELLMEESTANEQTIALWRLLLCLVAAAQVVARDSFHAEGMTSTDWASLVCVFGAMVYSCALWALISRERYVTWLSYVSVGLDITLITAVLLAMAATGHGLAAVNNPLSLPLYLLAISLAGLRYNPRVTVFATLLAASEYAGLVAYVIRCGDLRDQAQIWQYGEFDFLTQLTRLILIGAAGVLATFTVRRARELRTASIVDALTQVFNRAFMEERFGNEFARAERYGRHLSLVILDVDHFKAYNDRHGHLAGDQALREVADLLRYGLRNTDIVARYGGEEFVALLPEAPKDVAMRLADRLRQQVASHSFLYGQQQPEGALTISLGVATYPDDAAELPSLLQHADDSLYRAKRAGRNRVCG